MTDANVPTETHALKVSLNAGSMPDDVEDEIAYSMRQIDNFLENFDLHEDGDGLGFLLDWTNHGKNVTSVEANIRTLDADVPGDYRYDISLTYEDQHPELVLMGPYQRFIGMVEEAYPAAEVQARPFDQDGYSLMDRYDR